MFEKHRCIAGCESKVLQHGVWEKSAGYNVILTSYFCSNVSCRRCIFRQRCYSWCRECISRYSSACLFVMLHCSCTTMGCNLDVHQFLLCLYANSSSLAACVSAVLVSLCILYFQIVKNLQIRYVLFYIHCFLNRCSIDYFDISSIIINHFRWIELQKKILSFPKALFIPLSKFR